jgi:uncharacterized membrane protein YfcA
MIKEIILILLGLFSGFYASFVGTTGGVAIMIFLLQYFKLVDSVTAIAGTMVFLSALPLGVFGIYNYYIHKDIDYYVALMLIIGIIIGLIYGSKYAFVINDVMGEKTGDKIKNGSTAVIYAIISLMYAYTTIKGSP